MSCRDCGRLVVRYSGTEPLLRVMIESDDAAKNDRLMDELLETIGKRARLKSSTGVGFSRIDSNLH